MQIRPASINLRQAEDALGFVHYTESFGAVDGPGIRYVFFLKGCPLRCLYCHNPDAIDCEGGRTWTAKQLVDEVLRYKSFIKNGGVTFSGGEPLMQADFVWACISLLHTHGIHCAIDTSGFASLSNISVKNAIDSSDLLLLDIKAISPALAQTITGQSNALSLAILDYCEKTKKKVWVRHVLVDGYTLCENELKALANYLSNFSCIERLELLPFHKLGEEKWQLTDLEYTLKDVPATTEQQLNWAKQFFKNLNFKTI